MARVKIVKVSVEKTSGDQRWWEATNKKGEHLTMAPNPLLALYEGLGKFYRPKRLLAWKKEFDEYLKYEERRMKKRRRTA